MTFNWNFCDIFIIVISIGLTDKIMRFNQHLHQVLSEKNSINTKAVWRTIRSDYVQLCGLVESVNNFISPIIVLSCLGNFYFICLQVLQVFS